MVVVAAGHQRKTWPDRLNETVNAVLEMTDVAVLVVKREREALERMLICTAAGEPGKSDVRVGGWLARRLGVPVTLLHVTHGSTTPSTLAKGHLQRAAATLRAFDVPAEIRVREAKRAAEGILAEAEGGNHDLIVVGGHGPQSRSAFALDDVTLQVLAGTDKPVLVVPAEEV